MNKVEFGKVEELEYSINEAYKTLRTNLSFCGDEIKAILLTSCRPNEGKSTVAFRLAEALAEDGKKVVIVDADLRKSVFLGRYGITSNVKIKGLSHYLSGQAELDDVVYETNYENFHIVFAGPSTPNSTELLGNHYFENMIKLFREHYDYILVDATPLGLVIDAAVITKVCDGAIFVIENDVISYKLAQEVKKQLELTECKILGAILNKVNADTNRKYTGYYRGYGRYGKKYSGYGQYVRYGRYDRSDSKDSSDSEKKKSLTKKLTNLLDELKIYR